jgi:hypothetical protein
MKTLERLVLLFVIALAIFTASLSNGCKNAPPARVAMNVEQASQITVTAAMGVWNDYIKEFHPTIEQQRKVRSAYNKYRTAMLNVTRIGAATADIGTSETLDESIANAAKASAEVLAVLREVGVKL